MLHELSADTVLLVGRALLPMQVSRALQVCRLWADTLSNRELWWSWVLLHFPAAAELCDLPAVHPKWLYLRCFEASVGYCREPFWNSYGHPQKRDVRFMVRIERLPIRPGPAIRKLMDGCFRGDQVLPPMLSPTFDCAWPCMPDFATAVDPRSLPSDEARWELFQTQLDECFVEVVAVRLDTPLPTFLPLHSAFLAKRRVAEMSDPEWDENMVVKTIQRIGGTLDILAAIAAISENEDGGWPENGWPADIRFELRACRVYESGERLPAGSDERVEAGPGHELYLDINQLIATLSELHMSSRGLALVG